MALTAEFNAVAKQITVMEDGTVMVCVENRDANGQAINEACMTFAPANDVVPLQPVQHSKTGNTGVVPSTDLLGAVTGLKGQVDTMLAAVIAAGKHTL